MQEVLQLNSELTFQEKPSGKADTTIFAIRCLMRAALGFNSRTVIYRNAFTVKLMLEVVWLRD